MLEECAALDRKNEGEPLACNILCNLARVQLAICEHQKAEDLFRECLRKLPPGQRQNIGAAALAGLAEIFLQREMLEAAEDALREAGGFSAIDAGVENAVELRALRMRLCRKRGNIEEAIGLGTEPGGPETGRYGAARVALELGTAYRELGPDWADKTEKYLERSLKEFESMGCPVEASEALGELSIYWYLTGEEEESGEHLGRGETILDSGQLGARRSRFTERFKTR
jgi:tetratricopeptide (TPR) repeat protein